MSGLKAGALLHHAHRRSRHRFLQDLHLHLKHLPIDDKIIQAQQATADLFYQNRLLPKAIDVKTAVWRSQAR